MKKAIALILACALVVPSLTACSSAEFSGVIQDVGSQVYDLVEDREEIESIVADIIANELDIPAASEGETAEINAPETEEASAPETDAAKETAKEIETDTKAEIKTATAETEKAAEKETEAETEAETEIAEATASEVTASEATTSEIDATAVLEAIASKTTESEAATSEAKGSKITPTDDATGAAKERKLKFILEFYDDGSIEVKMNPETEQQNQED